MLPHPHTSVVSFLVVDLTKDQILVFSSMKEEEAQVIFGHAGTILQRRGKKRETQIPRTFRSVTPIVPTSLLIANPHRNHQRFHLGNPALRFLTASHDHTVHCVLNLFDALFHDRHLPVHILPDEAATAVMQRIDPLELLAQPPHVQEDLLRIPAATSAERDHGDAETHGLTNEIKDSENVVRHREFDSAQDGRGAGSGVREQRARGEVVVEGESFDELLQAARDVALVAVRIDAPQVRSDAGEDSLDFG